jgi:chondroitin 4-sulfotransferase 11
MIIDRKNNFVFIHISKTGGSSICNSYMDAIGNTTRREGLAWQCVVHQGGMMHDNYTSKESIINSMFTTAIVRNPFDRWVSGYHSMTREKNRNLFKGETARYIHRVALDNPFDEWVKRGIAEHSKWNTAFVRRQVDYLKNSKNKIDIDLLGHFEEYSKFISDLNSSTNLSFKESFKNSSKHNHYREYFSKELRSVVEEYNKEDLETFNYEF